MIEIEDGQLLGEIRATCEYLWSHQLMNRAAVRQVFKHYGFPVLEPDELPNKEKVLLKKEFGMEFS